jgi:hypothetical protein
MSIDREKAAKLLADVLAAVIPEPTQPADELQCFTYAEVGDLLGHVSEDAVEAMVKRGELQSIRAGRKRVIPARSLRHFIYVQGGSTTCHDAAKTGRAPSTNAPTGGGSRRRTLTLHKGGGDKVG